MGTENLGLSLFHNVGTIVSATMASIWNKRFYLEAWCGRHLGLDGKCCKGIDMVYNLHSASIIRWLLGGLLHT